MGGARIGTEVLKSHVAEESLTQAVYLDLSSLEIECIDHLDLVPNVRTLLLHNNRITTVENLDSCKDLWSVNLSHNQITSIEGISRFAVFGHVDLSYNLLETDQLAHLRDTQILSINLQNNPFTKEYDERTYRYYVINVLPSIWVLDHIFITSEERESALKFYESSPPRVSTPVPSKSEGFVNSFKRNVSKIYSSAGQDFIKNFSRDQTTSKVIQARRLKYLLKLHQSESYEKRTYMSRIESKRSQRSSPTDFISVSQLDLISLLTCTEEQKEKLLLLLYAIKRSSLATKDIAFGLQKLLSCSAQTADEVIHLEEEPLNCIILLLYLSLRIADDSDSRKVLLDFLAKIEKITHTPEPESPASPEMTSSIPKMIQNELKDEIPYPTDIIVPIVPMESSKDSNEDSKSRSSSNPPKKSDSSTKSTSKGKTAPNALVPYKDPSESAKKVPVPVKKKMRDKTKPGIYQAQPNDRQRNKLNDSAPPPSRHASSNRFAKRPATTRNSGSNRRTADPVDLKYHLDIDPNYRSAEFYSVRLPLPGDKVTLAPGVTTRVVQVVDTVTIRLAPINGMKKPFEVDTRAMFWNSKGFWQHSNEITKSQAVLRRQMAGLEPSLRSKRASQHTAKITSLFSYDHTMDANFVLAPTAVVEEENSRLHVGRVPCWDPIHTAPYKKFDDKAMVVRTKQLAPVRSTVDHILADRYREEYTERLKLIEAPMLEYHKSGSGSTTGSKRSSMSNTSNGRDMVVYKSPKAGTDARSNGSKGSKSGYKQSSLKDSSAQSSKPRSILSNSSKDSSYSNTSKPIPATKSDTKISEKHDDGEIFNGYSNNIEGTSKSTMKKGALPTMPEFTIEDISDEEEKPKKPLPSDSEGFFTTAFDSEDEDQSAKASHANPPPGKNEAEHTHIRDTKDERTSHADSVRESEQNDTASERAEHTSRITAQAPPQFYYLDKPKKKRGGSHNWYIVPKKTTFLVAASTIRPMAATRTVPAFDREGAACFVSVREVPRSQALVLADANQVHANRDSISRTTSRSRGSEFIQSQLMTNSHSHSRQLLPMGSERASTGAESSRSSNRMSGFSGVMAASAFVPPNVEIGTKSQMTKQGWTGLPPTKRTVPLGASNRVVTNTRRGNNASGSAPAPTNSNQALKTNKYIPSYPAFSPADGAPTPFNQS